MLALFKEMLFAFFYYEIKKILAIICAGPLALLLYVKLATYLSVWICIGLGVGIPFVLLSLAFIRYYVTMLRRFNRDEYFQRQPLLDFPAKGFRMRDDKMLTGKIEGFYISLMPSNLLDKEQIDLTVSVHAEPAVIKKDFFEVGGTYCSVEAESDHVAVRTVLVDIENTYTADQLYFLLTRMTEVMKEMNLEPAILEGDPDRW